MQRVLTPFGLGVTANRDSVVCTVAMDAAPTITESVLKLSAREVFTFSNHAILRVLNTVGNGILSNLLFYESREKAKLAIANTARSPEETWALLDFQAGTAHWTQNLGAATPRFLYLHPWVHLWGREISPYDQPEFDTTEKAINAFNETLVNLLGSTGICSSLLIDTKKKMVLRLVLAIAPPQGIIVDWTRGDWLPVEIPG